MIKAIVFLSVDQMTYYPADANTVVVSILDASEAHHRPPLAGFHDVLRLVFEDTYEEVKCAVPGDWPDEPTDEEHRQFAQGKGERVPALSNARAITEFLLTHQHTPREFTLVAHCFGGISRSAAVAVWAAVRFGVPISNADMRSTDWANARLIRLMDKADGRR